MQSCVSGVGLGRFHLAPHSCRIPFHVGEVKTLRRHAHKADIPLRCQYPILCRETEYGDPGQSRS